MKSDEIAPNSSTDNMIPPANEPNVLPLEQRAEAAVSSRKSSLSISDSDEERDRPPPEVLLFKHSYICIILSIQKGSAEFASTTAYPCNFSKYRKYSYFE